MANDKSHSGQSYSTANVLTLHDDRPSEPLIAHQPDGATRSADAAPARDRRGGNARPANVRRGGCPGFRRRGSENAPQSALWWSIRFFLPNPGDFRERAGA